MLIINFILITALAGWWLSTTEISAGFSGLIATGAIRKRYMGLAIVLFVVAGGCLFSNRLHSTIAAMLFALAIGMNNGILLLTLNETISLEFDFFINNLDIKDEYILLFLSVLFITLIGWNRTSLRINMLSEREFDINIESVLIMLVAGVLVLSFFSIPALCAPVGLSATPLSIAGIMLGGFAGINIIKKEKNIIYKEEGKYLLSILAIPLISFVISYFFLNIIDTHALVTKGSKIAVGSRGVVDITPHCHYRAWLGLCVSYLGLSAQATKNEDTSRNRSAGEPKQTL